MSCPKVMEWVEGFTMDGKRVRSTYPTMGIDMVKRLPSLACSVCTGRGVLVIIGSPIKNNTGAEVGIMPDWYIPCQSCYGTGFPPAALDDVLKYRIANAV